MNSFAQNIVTSAVQHEVFSHKTSLHMFNLGEATKQETVCVVKH